MKIDDLITGLPGESLVRQGLADANAGRQTVAAFLVSIASPRLIRAGLLTGVHKDLAAEPELSLYRLLRTQGGDAYSKYNALLRELVSFEQALDHRLQKLFDRGQRLKTILDKGHVERDEPLDAEGIARELRERRGRFH